MVQFPQAPEYPIRGMLNFYEIRGDIQNFMFITGVSDKGNKLFTRRNRTGKQFLPVSTTRN
jgi:hypothetical protein